MRDVIVVHEDVEHNPPLTVTVGVTFMLANPTPCTVIEAGAAVTRLKELVKLTAGAS